MNLLGLLPGILKTAGKILGIGKLSEAADALGSAQIPPEKQAELQEALVQETVQLRQLDVDELRAMLTAQTSEIQSEDAYVRRARPTGLYLFYGCSVLLVVAEVAGVKIDPTAILTIMGPLGGVGATYVYRRTTEKLADSQR